MSDISNTIQEAQLMKQNRADLITVLNQVGFPQVNAQTPLSEVAKYMQWAGGLLDVRLATFSKATMQHRYWSYDEWMGTSAQVRSMYIQMGVVLRAEGQAFIIAKQNATSDSGTSSIAWGPGTNNIRGLTYFSSNPAMYDDMDGEANTNIILNHAESAGVDYPAARRARAYKCCSVSDGGLDDPTVWSLPAFGQEFLINKYYNEIAAAFSQFGMTAIPLVAHWTSTLRSSSSAWFYYVSQQTYSSTSITIQYAVRPVAKVQPTESAAPQAL